MGTTGKPLVLVAHKKTKMKKRILFAVALFCCVMGVNAQIKVKSNGNVGIGVTNPQYLLDVSINKGIRFTDWTSVIFDKNGMCGSPCLYPSRDWYLQLGQDKQRVGTIFVQTIHADHIYNDSDSTFKCGFSKLNREYGKFRQLKPYKYKFTKEFMGRIPEKERQKFDHEHYGFKAQDIVKIYPELTYKDDSTGKYSVNYIGFIPILVEMVQELQSTVDAQSKKIKELEKEISSNSNTFVNPRKGYKKMLAPSSAIEDEETEELIEEDITTNAFLFQNTPNPFSTQTEIRYYLPENADNAVLYVFSLNGNMLLSKPLTQTGNGIIIINGSELKPGMYIYTLAVNGVEADSKRMILTDK